MSIDQKYINTIITEISKDEYLKLNRETQLKIHQNTSDKRKTEGYYNHVRLISKEAPLDPNDPYDYEFGKSADLF